MAEAVSTYERRCEEEMDAADRAPTTSERLAHLELALGFALLASRAREKSEVVELKSGGAPKVPFE